MAAIVTGFIVDESAPHKLLHGPAGATVRTAE
jgi:hypothetical protein